MIKRKKGETTLEVSGKYLDNTNLVKEGDRRCVVQ
jgi:hypothetical protein